MSNCKRVDPNGNITIRVCNKSSIPVGYVIRYEVYAGYGATTFSWTLNK